MKKLFNKKPSLLLALLILTTCSILLIEAIKGIIELLDLIRELLVISIVYIVFSTIVPNLYPKKIDPETVFIGGATKPPYVNPNEVYLPYSILLKTKNLKKKKSNFSR